MTFRQWMLPPDSDRCQFSYRFERHCHHECPDIGASRALASPGFYVPCHFKFLIVVTAWRNLISDKFIPSYSPLFCMTTDMVLGTQPCLCVLPHPVKNPVGAHDSFLTEIRPPPNRGFVYNCLQRLIILNIRFADVFNHVVNFSILLN